MVLTERHTGHIFRNTGLLKSGNVGPHWQNLRNCIFPSSLEFVAPDYCFLPELTVHSFISPLQPFKQLSLSPPLPRAFVCINSDVFHLLRKPAVSLNLASYSFSDFPSFQTKAESMPAFLIPSLHCLQGKPLSWFWLETQKNIINNLTQGMRKTRVTLLLHRPPGQNVGMSVVSMLLFDTTEIAICAVYSLLALLSLRTQGCIIYQSPLSSPPSPNTEG